MKHRNIIFGLGVAGILILSWWLNSIHQPRTDNAPLANSQIATVEKGEPTPQPVKEPAPRKNIDKSLVDRIYKIENEFLALELNGAGGLLAGATIKNYNNNKLNFINFFQNSSANESLGLTFKLNSADIDTKSMNWNINSNQSAAIDFTSSIQDQLQINKNIQITNDYRFNVIIKYKNISNEIILISNSQIGFGPISSDPSSQFNKKEAVLLTLTKIERIHTSKKADQQLFNLEKGWAALRDQYFCLIVYSGENTTKQVSVNKFADSSLGMGISLPEVKLSPGQELNQEINIYLGPQDYQLLKSFNKKFEKILHFGMFHSIGVWMLYVLKFFFQITNNYGLAIILITILIRLILWWPTHKSYTSMKHMATAMNKMQPRLKTLKEIYKKDPTKLNEETMKLYREYQINPMGGCLPMLLQMPVFFALYSTLSSAVELKGANFIWFWKDLSAKDPYYVLPIAMGLTMFIQQKMSTPPSSTPEAAAQQKMMMYLMPAMLTFFSFMWPSGLLLYWVVSNIASIAQQIFVNQSKA
jgi:YidC/Oxa1 family membrane protein insertase